MASFFVCGLKNARVHTDLHSYERETMMHSCVPACARLCVCVRVLAFVRPCVLIPENEAPLDSAKTPLSRE